MKKNVLPRVLFPIGVKLVLVITVLFLLSLGAVITLVSVLSSADVKRTAEYNNFTINRRAGSQAESYFNFVKTAVCLYLDMNKEIDQTGSQSFMNNFFKSYQNVAAVEYLDTGNEKAIIQNERFLLSNNISNDKIESFFNSNLFPENIRSDRIDIINASVFFNHLLFGAVFSYDNQIVKVLFSSDDIAETFGIGANTSFIVADNGTLLLHPDNDLVLQGTDFSSLQIVKMMQQQGDNGGMQISFEDNGQLFFGAYYRLSETNTVVFTTIPHAVVFEAVRSITLQNILLTGIVLFIAVLFIWFFSKTIAAPVRSLADAALQIEGGDFGIELQSKAKDEIGLLTESFSKMTGALNVFGRFTNKDIAVRAMRGEIKPGGLAKHATIFFSDIRGFTEKSENFTKVFGDNASNKIIEWLNAYFTKMVECVEKTGGVVDKFIGDAVMAHWGTAFTAGSPEADAFNAVHAAVMMRNSLYKLNKQRQKDDPANPIINIGCGLNSGIVTAGQLGSEQRMEYTVIGDPVNLASRTEALNKPLGTDILITEDTWNLIGEKFITEEMPSVTVKGKEKPVRMFAVVNMKGAQGPQTLAEVRKMLNITPPDLNKVDTNAEEKKYKIQSD